jgi:ferredoxin
MKLGIKPSTRRLIKEAQHTSNYSWFDFLHGYIYARWPYLYIGIGVGEHPIAKKWGPWYSRFAGWFENLVHTVRRSAGSSPPARLTVADTYHGKVVPLRAASQLVMVHEDISLPNLEHIIPYPRARDLILQNPDHIAVLDCPCRAARENPCLPLDVCLIIGEPFASFVLEHHARRSRRISQAEALAILQAEDERGHVHHAFFKDAMLNRFYAICNCCACCCGAMQAQRRGMKMLASSGYVAHADRDRCIGCGDCQDLCQFGAIELPDGYSQIDQAICMGCGVCVEHCQQEALSLVREASKGEPLEIEALSTARD